MNETVLLKKDGHIAEVSLNRPTKMNSLDRSVLDGLSAAGEEIKADPNIRAVILTGEGDNFSAGIDLNFVITALKPNDFRQEVLQLAEGEIANTFQKPSYVWQEIEVPVIAALRGVVFGGGAQIALGADIRIAAPDIRMSIMEIKWGLIPDMGLTTSLPRLMPIDVAKKLVFSGDILDAEAAKSAGLVTEIAADPLEAARELAQKCVGKNPDALRAGKRLLNDSWTAPPAASLRMEAELQASVLGEPNQIEAVQANMQKRAPNFKPRG